MPKNKMGEVTAATVEAVIVIITITLAINKCTWTAQTSRKVNMVGI